MVNTYSGFRLPTIPMAHMFEHSPIEHLFYISIMQYNAAAHLEFSLYYAAKTVCNNKYYIDFALCDRKTGKVQIGIESDGFLFIIIHPQKVENNNMRDREIKD